MASSWPSLAYGLKKAYHLESLTVGKIVALCAVAVVTVPLARVISFGLRGRLRIGVVPVLVVGTGKLAQTVAGHLRAQSGVEFVGFVDDNPLGNNEVLGELDELPELCRRYRVARVVVCFSRTHPERTTEMLKSLAGQVGVSIVPRYYELITFRSHVEDLSGLPMIDIAPTAMTTGARFLKRAFDIAVSTAALLVLSPFILVIAAAIKCTSHGPVFFRQQRTGRNEQPFYVLKFRTMFEDAEARRSELEHLNEMDGPLFKVRNDPRVTRIGRFLRRTSLDEIPQLINVWKGDMSLVGPSALRGGRSPGHRGLGPQTVRDPAGDDRSLAGIGAQRALAPRALPPRLPLRGVLVAVVGHADPLADAGHRPAGPRRLLIGPD